MDIKTSENRKCDLLEHNIHLAESFCNTNLHYLNGHNTAALIREYAYFFSFHPPIYYKMKHSQTTLKDTRLIRTPLYYGQFALFLGNLLYPTVVERSKSKHMQSSLRPPGTIRACRGPEAYIQTGLTTDYQSWSVRSDTFSSGRGPNRYCSAATGSLFGGTLPFCVKINDKDKTVNQKVAAIFQ